VNERIRIIGEQTLSDDWGLLKKTTFEYRHANGKWQTQSRETYDRGDAAVILLYNLENQSVVLTRQFRFPVYAKGEPYMLLEACAGLNDGLDAESRIRAEAEEETGYRLGEVTHLFDSYMSPGSVTEKLSFFLGHYDASTRISGGGGLVEEGEDIEVVELPFKTAYAMIFTGEIVDAKTIMLLQHAALSGLLER